MLEAADLGHVVSASEYDAALPRIRADLLAAHLQLRSLPTSVIVIVSGADGAGKGELVHRLSEWLDPRGVETHAFWTPTDEERERPPYWRFWRAMPGRGRIGILFGSWYTEPVIRRVYGEMKPSQFDSALDRISAFEKMLTDDGAVLVKLWLHLPREQQKKRLKRLEKQGRIAPADWKHFKLFDKFTKASERALRRTDMPCAPWHVIEATDRRYRELTCGRVLLDALKSLIKPTRTAKSSAAGSPPAKPEREKSDSILAHVDLTQCLSETEYAKRLDTLQSKLSKLTWTAQEKKISMVMVFEGWDAAGKGSAIRRVTQAIDPRLYRVVGIAAPTDEERAQHYLWRFWRHLPRAGFVTIFDRSWYGRVLVERVEGFAQPSEWSRAYHEINEFEEQLSDHGILILKFWLHISPEEQLRRFKERQSIAYKRYKITDEDWRNRQKWGLYQQAVDEMVARCSTEFAPWILVAGNDKRFARVQILRAIVSRLESAL
ncbi:MAG TPA: polyphosphate:AMP phosphotransferase [Opitutaceae bacterium]|nr:polyphosphate:AMP phosphotransferase [Opitutaceae bacterium]